MIFSQNSKKTNFQDVNGLLTIPKGIEYHFENNKHYLLVALQSGSLVLLDFGSDLDSTQRHHGHGNKPIE